MIFESAGDLPTSVEAKGEAGFFFPAPPSLFFAGKGNHPKKIIWRKQDQVHNDQASQGGPGGHVVRVVSLDDMLSKNIWFSCPKSSNN